MTAKKMFEKLGYEREYNYIAYIGEDIKYIKEDIILRFCMTEVDNSFQIISKFEQVDLNLEELKAINKQVEELGWLDVNITN